MSSLFIAVELSGEVGDDPELAKQLQEACPVDIFRASSTGTEIVDDNVDECILCGLCVDAAPPGGVRVIKRYDESSVLER